MARPIPGATALGLALGWVADLALGDPQRAHPVAAFGRAAQALESRLYRDDRPSGVAYTALLVGASTGLGWAVQHAARGRWWATAATTAAATWVVLGGRSLVRVSERIASHLSSGDLAAARTLMPSLVSRDPELLDADGIARATLESVAENTSDAVVAPLFWGACLGAPGLLGYRAVNTLDAMVAYRNDRYRNFGWAAAKVDDLANALHLSTRTLQRDFLRLVGVPPLWVIRRRRLQRHRSSPARRTRVAAMRPPVPGRCRK